MSDGSGQPQEEGIDWISVLPASKIKKELTRNENIGRVSQEATAVLGMCFYYWLVSCVGVNLTSLVSNQFCKVSTKVSE